MADSYHIIDGQVVPFHGGRKDTNTGAWRDATPMELQLQAELCAAERALEEATDALEAAREDAERWRQAFVDERASRYRADGMKIEQARIHAETDAEVAAIDQARGKGVAE